MISLDERPFHKEVPLSIILNPSIFRGKVEMYHFCQDMYVCVYICCLGIKCRCINEYPKQMKIYLTYIIMPIFPFWKLHMKYVLWNKNKKFINMHHAMMHISIYLMFISASVMAVIITSCCLQRYPEPPPRLVLSTVTWLMTVTWWHVYVIWLLWHFCPMMPGYALSHLSQSGECWWNFKKRLLWLFACCEHNQVDNNYWYGLPPKYLRFFCFYFYLSNSLRIGLCTYTSISRRCHPYPFSS